MPFYETDPNLQLLSTIKMPLKLHYLTDCLPAPNYDPIKFRQSYNDNNLDANFSSKKNNRAAHSMEKRISNGNSFH